MNSNHPTRTHSTLRSVLIGLAITLVLGVTAHAAPVTFTVSGTVTLSTHGDANIQAAYGLGEAWSATVTYDPAIARILDQGAGLQDFWDGNNATIDSFEIGGLAWGSSTQADSRIILRDSGSSFELSTHDQLTFSTSVVSAVPDIAGLAVSLSGLSLNFMEVDPNPTAIENETLPSDFTLAQFPDAPFGNLSLAFNYNGSFGLVRGVADTLEFSGAESAVPAPPVWLIALVGLAGLVRARRQRG